MICEANSFTMAVISSIDGLCIWLIDIHGLAAPLVVPNLADKVDGTSCGICPGTRELEPPTSCRSSLGRGHGERIAIWPGARAARLSSPDHRASAAERAGNLGMGQLAA